MPGGSRPARCWRRLSQLDGRLVRHMDRANLLLSLVPLALFRHHAPTALVVGAGIAWAMSFAFTLPATMRSIAVSWRAGTRAKWQVRILRSHAAELSELNVELSDGDSRR